MKQENGPNRQYNQKIPEIGGFMRTQAEVARTAQVVRDSLTKESHQTRDFELGYRIGVFQSLKWTMEEIDDLLELVNADSKKKS